MRLAIIRQRYSPAAGAERFFEGALEVLHLKGEAVPLYGFSLYADVYWNKLLTSSVGYSMVNLDNTSLQPVTAYHQGQYASVNVLAHPAPNFLIGPELQWAKRTDNDSANGTDTRIQISAKYAFSTSKDFWK